MVPLAALAEAEEEAAAEPSRSRRRWRDPNSSLSSKVGRAALPAVADSAAKPEAPASSSDPERPFSASSSQLDMRTGGRLPARRVVSRFLPGGLSRPPFADGSDAPYPPIPVVADRVSLGCQLRSRRAD